MQMEGRLRRVHLGYQHVSPARITNLEGLCTYPVIRPDSTESITTQPTIDY